MDQSAKAAALGRLHHGPAILVLPNAWDAASARVFEDAGFPAIATSSAGVAFACGYPDGQRIPRVEMIDAVGRIARCVAVPVTADLEAGYSDLAATIEGMISAGAVGLNLEDMEGGELIPIPRQIERLGTVRAIGDRHGIHLVVNARTDIYLAEIGEPESRFERAVERLRAYAEAGADCVFVPGVRDKETIGRLVCAVDCPLNILGVAGAPPVARLQELGVRRVSVGSGPARAAMALTRRIAQELLNQGTYGSFTDQSIPYAEVNAMFQR